MAFFHGNFFSVSLLSSVDVHVFLPLPRSGDFAADGSAPGFGPDVRFPVLYLLHGAYGDGMDWIEQTRLASYAQARRLAVVTAPAGNSFYRDAANGPAFEQFFARELPALVETVFPLSSRREDRFVAGLSMGGYGALRLALRNPQRFAAAASLSGAFDLEQSRARLAAAHPAGAAVFGQIDAGGREQWDLTVLARQALDAGAALPPMLLSCGTEDFVLDANRAQRDAFQALGISFTYEEHPGAHDWDYWDAHLRTILDWLPLRQEGA